MLEKGEVDIGIASPSSDDAMDSFKPLLKDSVGLVCSCNHSLASVEARLDWSQIENEHFITNGSCHMIKSEEFKQILEQSEILCTKHDVVTRINISRSGYYHAAVASSA